MKAAIIGGGIIGLSSAYYLNQAGWDVTVFEREDLSDNCSFGNMGYLSPSHFVPLAQPGVVSQGILWMFDQKSPFYVRPELSWPLIDWGLKFVRACNTRNVERSARPMTDLLLLSRKLTAEWARSDEFAFEYHENGCINYYRTEKYEKGELETVRAGRDLGLDIRILSREEIHELEPELKPDVRGGAWYRDDAHLHPNSLMRELKSVLERKGVMIRTNTEVTGIEKKSGKINTLRLSDGSAWTGDLVVLAAGSWSREVARMAGEYLPVMPGKGYSMTVDVAHQPLKHPCILLESKVAITPWEKKLRIGSTMEIGKVNDRILLPRVQGILEAVPKYLPGYTDDPAFREMSDLTKLKENLRSKVWYGFRPLSVDGLPYIGYAKKTSNLIIASGHAMLGLSFGAGTGKLVTELADGKPTSVGVEAFDPGRV
ncbi:MAG: hypothetical protein RJA20_2808 [Bacteroidota bacterium]